MRRFFFTLLVFLCAFGIIGCGEEEPEVTSATPKAVYVINGSAQTISVFDIEKAQMKNDVLTVGKWPADIKILGDKAYVVNTGDNNIQIIDLVSLNQIGLINVGDNTGPERIGFVSDKKAYVSCLNTNAVKVVDLVTQQATKEIGVGIAPWGVAIAEGKVYVCNTAYDFATNSYGKGTVSVIDSSTDIVSKTLDVGTNPTEITAYGNSVLVLCTGNYVDVLGKLCIIDTVGDTVVKTIDLGITPSGIAVSPKGVAYMTTSAGLISVDISTGSMIHSATDPLSDFAGGSGLAFSKDGTCYICVPDWTGGGNDKLLVMDTSEKLVGTYKPGGGASIIAIKE